MEQNFAAVIEKLAKTDFVVFAGTGVVKAAGVADWRSLLKALLAEVPGARVDLAREPEGRYPEIAQMAYDHLDDRYYEIIEEQVRPRVAGWSTAQTQIWKSARHVITTNFEDSFLMAFRDLHEENDVAEPDVRELPDLTADLHATESSLTYLHGRIEPRAIILKTSDYERFYPSVCGKDGGADNLERYLTHVYETRTLVFVGVSFEDKYLRDLLGIIHAKLNRNDATNLEFRRDYAPRVPRIQHYAFLREPESVDDSARRLDAQLEAARIQVLRYREHADYLTWLQKIRRAKKEIRNQTGDMSPATGSE